MTSPGRTSVTVLPVLEKSGPRSWGLQKIREPVQDQLGPVFTTILYHVTNSIFCILFSTIYEGNIKN